jgi:ATP-dependent helicase/nuclease subunit A
VKRLLILRKGRRPAGIAPCQGFAELQKCEIRWKKKMTLRSMTTVSNIPDLGPRERALTLGESFIVRAPAGSGKTELLTRRFLKLLAAVDEPEEILAITFTRAATAEMRSRVLRCLEDASRSPATQGEDDILLARAALAHSEARGWKLLEQPHRLNIETIDSLCLRIAHNQPLLSRMGGRLSPTENAGPLYAQAARRTLGRLGSADPELEAALRHMLELRDNNLPDCEGLIAGMLARRDQWIRAFPLAGNIDENDWDRARSRLEEPFRNEVRRVHAEAYRLMTLEPVLAGELVVLARYACDNGNLKIAPLAGIHALPKPEAVAAKHWRCIVNFLLTEDEWRTERGLNRTFGFPSITVEQKKMKRRMGKLLTRLQQIPGLREVLCTARDLPEPHYEERQWETLRHIFVTLRPAVAELRVLFAEQDTVDFTELSLAAREVLSSPDASPDVLLALSGNIRHFLVDEFQDTSRSQHELLRLLVRAWEAGDGRTCFFVGDPMQSVYLFRQAEVELFEHVATSGLLSENHAVTLEPLELLANFRSHEGLTTRWNEMFEAVFNSGNNTGAGQVRYSHTVATKPALPGEDVHVYPQIIGDADREVEPAEQEQALDNEAEQVLAIIAQHQERIEKAQKDRSDYRVAVLVRSRPHLAKIVALLRKRGVPFRGVELETLNERQELIDLLSLVRALAHPMGRVAWLSVLRAPWCGLTLEDLHALTGADDPAFRDVPVLELMESRVLLLSQDGAARLRRVSAILKQALATRFEGLHAASFSQWIERTWRSLGGPECMDAAAYENAHVFFAMLDRVTPDGIAGLTDDFEAEMAHLYAQPDPRVSERAGVQLMTIHKAKGLGFDVVIVPGLNRGAATDRPPLICSLERTNPATGEPEMLAAPIGGRDGEKHPTYGWVQEQQTLRADEELKRLLYVACTRARRSLHLLGTATMTRSGLQPGDAKSLLATAWPALQPDFEKALREREKEQASKVVAFPAGKIQGELFDIAAGAEDDTGTGAQPKLLLRRLQADADLKPQLENLTFTGMNAGWTEPAWARPEGSRDARQKGSVVHALLEQLSQGVPIDALPATARSLLRAFGYTGRALEDAAVEVLVAVKNCVSEQDGAWILASHAQAQSEASWTAWKGGTLETLRADRVFIAGAAPREPGEDHLWVVDYKMSAPAGDAGFLVHQRAIYAPQLARYAHALREAQGIELPVCFGLYYPRIACLDWWSEKES